MKDHNGKEWKAGCRLSLKDTFFLGEVTPLAFYYYYISA